MWALLRLFVFGVFLLGVLGFERSARAASDPSLKWYTIETKHFRITYHSGIEEVAQRVANVAEGIHDAMAANVGWDPKDWTEIQLIDSSESANGSATALPYNAIRLLVTAPEDMSPLGDVDDWYLELVTHEFTHILHTDQIRGLPAIVNAVLGKTLAPNQAQPRWLLEGLAVYWESTRTSGGRLRNSQWDMFMRTDVLQNNVAPLDVFSNTPRRWPQGNIWYLYGSYFQQWIAETYGAEALRKVAADYGSQIIPWGINRSIRRATGETYVDMYPTWIGDLKKRYEAQAADVRKKGIREGVRLTYHGQIARYPRWIPKGAWSDHEGDLLYYKDDQNTRTGLYALPLKRDIRGNIVKVDEKHEELMIRAPGEAYSSFTPDGGLVWNSLEWYKNVFNYGDLERAAPGERSTFGTPDGGRTVIQNSLRAADPDVSPDGRRIVYIVNQAGTRTIQLADLGDERLENPRFLVPSARFEQAFTPRWSPDGTHIVYSVWKNGGDRDIRYVDVENGTYRDLMTDRALDGGPVFSPDGRFVYFHSDRTSGISNIFAWEVATNRFFQVSNVLTGAYSPEPSPDGKTLAYVGYSKVGFDIFAMPVDERTWTEAEPYVDTRPPTPSIPHVRYASRPYSPWATLWPRRYGIQVTPGNFGDAVIITASGSDISGFHNVSASTTTEIEKPQLQGSLAYSYARLPFDFGVSLFRTITPRGGFAIGNFKPTVIQENTGFSTSISYAKVREYDTSSFVISHALSRVGIDLPFPKDKLDPYETPQIPYRGLASSLHFGYGYSNAERYLYSVGPERGFSLGAGFDLTDPSLGSDFSGFAANADLTVYYLMPWLKHHSLAIHGGFGTSGGSFPGRGAFFVGGFVDLPIIDVVRNSLIQGGIVLRGYPPVILAGNSYTLTNFEYRFPIVNVDRGLSTLPVFLNRINGAVFFDYGSAFDDIKAAQYKSGVGGELWFDTILGYIMPFTFRLGYARGLASGGIDKVYFVAAVPY
ncbi:tolB protein precursor [Labilithrix luteola]|uniref:TolB protein n=1 Tax=Labilithrix luteola TaxID=1391654 RepID=A0A0K1PUQ3_9BACT|nr:tolB protein precursor [Labilithrix luteola]